jgi:16S rRNA (adenine1518-N6/adenine1519-N6)-dimethyltransferase
VLEIGPGTGALTILLARLARRVIAVEADERLRPLLERQLAGLTNVELHWADFLEVDLETLVGGEPYTVVANLPYYITSAILRKLLDHPHRPQQMVLTVQREVADRIVARDGERSLLSVSVHFYGKPEIILRVNPAVFWPRPDVDSAVIRIEVYPSPPVSVPDNETFFKVVRAGFGQKRKQLKNALSNGLRIDVQTTERLLETSAIDGRRRAETLSVEEWAALSRAYAAHHCS